ncbi:MAG TPA: hypothetical protein VGY52_07070 [Roseiarcus sp.]|nr:hypothetical protein [Roseiarcus sp.]
MIAVQPVERLQNAVDGAKLAVIRLFDQGLDHLLEPRDLLLGEIFGRERRLALSDDGLAPRRVRGLLARSPRF